MNLNLRKRPYLYIASHIAATVLLIGVVVRIVLACITPSEAGLSFGSIVRAIGIGLINDLCFAIIALLPVALTYIGLNDAKYRRPWGYIIEGLLVAACIYVFAFHSVFHDFGGGAPIVAQIYLGYKLLSFTLRLFVPRLRRGWRRVTVGLMWIIYIFCILFNALGEYLFWDEFGVRYNFIAVDYLVYTNEVVGNIIESYPVVPLMLALLLLCAGIIYVSARRLRFTGGEQISGRTIGLGAVVYAVAFVAACFGIDGCHRKLQSDNTYVGQLQANGGYCFLKAFQSNELDYASFYPMLSDAELAAALNEIGTAASADMVGTFGGQEPVNVVLISVESLSASYLSRYGGTEELTPRLDALASECIVFDSLYAVGNRTVRGLEALSICQPPTAGESIVKRPDNERRDLSIGQMLRGRGYTVQYIYGGDSYFDNMGDYFGKNGYDIIDKKTMSPDEITFANIWGVCDEDSYRKALKVLDANAAAGRPFFTHIMTVSNHRPFTYPEGKITMPDGRYKSREAGVKYTDYAIGQFLDRARSHPWFGRTVFVIIADHCAASAGKTSVPVYNYHIPCFIYAPELLQPRVVSTLCSQIDIMPTVLTMLGLGDALPPFAGRDIFAAGYRQRAFMATYQDLGYYEDGVLTVLSPVRKVRQYAVAHNPDGTTTETPLPTPRPDLLRRAQAYYQSANLRPKQ